MGPPTKPLPPAARFKLVPAPKTIAKPKHAKTTLLHPALAAWLAAKKIKPFAFQTECWQHIHAGQSGLLNAPTGAGKTYAILLGLLNQALWHGQDTRHGLHILWITPLRALAKDFYLNLEGILAELIPTWRAGLRMGDTTQTQRAAQIKAMPQILVTTPESLQLLISQKEHAGYFKNLHAVVVDEWHELLGNKRGTQLELGLAHLSQLKVLSSKYNVEDSINPLTTSYLLLNTLQRWAISATIGNMEQAQAVIMGGPGQGVLVRADVAKKYEFITVVPKLMERFPWSGHLGLHMAEQVAPLVAQARSCLLFCNTRAQAELWYHALLELMPELAGNSALHHGSLEGQIRTWVEEALREGRVKLVVTTSSLDLGVDFSPVDQVIQIGSPKGVGRMLQRAGRSGHRPGAVSRMYLVPTQAMEIIEFEALKTGAAAGEIEGRPPMIAPLDVLCQYLMTLAVGQGFTLQEVQAELAATHAYRTLAPERLAWCIQFLLHGGQSLRAYDDYAKIELIDGRYRAVSRRIAMRHRMAIGTIVSAQSLRIKFITGGYIGTVEESFISALVPGNTFWFAGRALEFIQLKGLDVLVRKSSKKKGQVPRWGGGRMPLSSNLSHLLRLALGQAAGHLDPADPLASVQELLAVQARWSAIPTEGQFLVEALQDRDGFHLFFYPFEGRMVHEILGALVAWRIAQVYPVNFTIAMNDYGFELLADEVLDAEELLGLDLFSLNNLRPDLERSINKTDLTRRRFREVATVAGLVFTGYPGANIAERHLRASSNLLYDMFVQYEPDNLLLQQALDEVFNFEVEASRLTATLERINAQQLILKGTGRPTPFAFPILTDGLREKLSGLGLEERILKMIAQLEKEAG